MRRFAAGSVRLAVAVAICLGGLGAAGVGEGHIGGSTGYASILISQRTIRYSLTLSPTALPPAVREDLHLGQSGHAPSRERWLGILREKIRLIEHEGRCVGGPGFLEAPSPNSESVTLVVDFGCPAAVRNLLIRDDVFDVIGPDHHTLAKIDSPAGTQQFAFTPDNREVRIVLEDSGSVGRGAGSFFLLGVEHILSGYDHLLFLLALLLRGGTLLRLLKIITAFTVAHSITLALAVLDIVVLPDRIVEAVIALSIAFVAAENLLFRFAVSRRWVLSFVFGLAHGFGFAAALRQLMLPRQSLAASLLGFNFGVESGQALVVVVVLPLLMLLRRSRWEARMVRSSSLAILIVGVVLFVERVLP